MFDQSREGCQNAQKKYDKGSLVTILVQKCSLISFYSVIYTVKPGLCTYSAQITYPPNHQESINVRIRGEWYIFQPIRDVLRVNSEAVKKQLRSFVEFGWIRPESPYTMTYSLQSAINYLETLQ